jgi:hypothetical protein
MGHMIVLGRSDAQSDAPMVGQWHRASVATPAKTLKCPTRGPRPFNPWPRCTPLPMRHIAMRRAPNHGLRGRGQMVPYCLKTL